MAFAAGGLKNPMNHALGGAPLPLWTQRFLDCHWWPGVALVLALIGAIASLTGKASDRILSHPLVGVLMLELWMMFTVVMALALPWVTLDWQIGP